MASRTDVPAASTGPGRRTILRGLAAAGTLCGLAAPHLARGVGTRSLKLGYVGPSDSQFGVGATEFARRIEIATGGAYRIEPYPNGVLGGEAEMLNGMRKGELDLGIISAVVFASVVPDFGVFDLPFLFRDAAHARAVLDGPIGQDFLDKFRARELMPLAWGENGVRHITNSRRPVRAPADLRGLKLRVPQSDVMLRCFRQLGVDAAPLAFPGVYGALESGRFDGQENPISVIRSTHLDRVQHHLTLSGHIYSSAIIFMSNDSWDDLSPAQCAAFTDVARASGLATREAAGQAERDGIEALQAAGMEIVPSVDRNAFLAALEPTWSELARQFGEDRIARIRAIAA